MTIISPFGNQISSTTPIKRLSLFFLKEAVSGERFPRSFQAERSPVASRAGAPAQHPELPPPLKARAVTPFQGFSKASPQTPLSIPQGRWAMLS